MPTPLPLQTISENHQQCLLTSLQPAHIFRVSDLSRRRNLNPSELLLAATCASSPALNNRGVAAVYFSCCALLLERNAMLIAGGCSVDSNRRSQPISLVSSAMADDATRPSIF
jgi:hypothetical protein